VNGVVEEQVEARNAVVESSTLSRPVYLDF